MTLLLDIGNTRLKWAQLSPAGKLHAGGVLAHGRAARSTQLAWAELRRPERILAASVAGNDFNAQLEALVQELWALSIEWARPGQGVADMVTAYPEPQRLGVDRWAASVGAYLASGKAVCVVDCGSAITFDAVTASGRHLGGLIVPGWRLMRQALHQGTAELPLVESETVKAIAADTATAIGSGTLLGAVAMVEGLSQRILGAMGGEVELWLTGGDAILLLPHLSMQFKHAPDLVLQGLAAIAGAAKP